MSAKGNGGTYHYYACSGRQKLGPKGCDGERIPRDKLEAAVVGQLASLYRDGDVIRDAVGKVPVEAYVAAYHRAKGAKQPEKAAKKPAKKAAKKPVKKAAKKPVKKAAKKPVKKAAKKR